MMEQLLCHLWGDYVLQSDWMAQNKTKAFLPAWLHASAYTFAFLFLKPSLPAVFVIMVSHFLIDRFRLARYVVWLKNWMGPWEYYIPGESMGRGRMRPTAPLAASPTGYPPETPVWLSVWLLIIADNTLHLTINYLALRYL